MTETVLAPSSKLILQLTADIVTTFVAHNSASSEDLFTLIRTVYDALSVKGEETPNTIERVPAVPVKKSVFPDYIICLEDGKKMTMLKRHLAKAYGLTPDQYRERWKLPPDYPMTAPDYTARRSQIARDTGLGYKIVKGTPGERVESPEMVDDIVVTKIPPRRRGRPKKQV
ncbi:MucR family transcriptional regulator [Brytella acorum]|uniref:MucR family transcriptional regulator n=1 Tax=Brytella acorum TaxID=2959299 RepID=A0AA35VA11_9PROT|nr:MucR family transcriptional regulator [Brytella acorum]CAI9122255.1 MucR family transcriptional regulator [Brytella acorum]